MAGALAERAGVDVSGGDDEKGKNRQSGLGALFGYGVGLGIGTTYGLIRPLLGGLPTPLAAIGLGLAAMAGSDVPATKLGATDPSTWDAASWVSDVLPHLAYGLVTAAVYQAFADR